MWIQLGYANQNGFRLAVWTRPLPTYNFLSWMEFITFYLLFFGLYYIYIYWFYLFLGAYIDNYCYLVFQNPHALYIILNRISSLSSNFLYNYEELMTLYNTFNPCISIIHFVLRATPRLKEEKQNLCCAEGRSHVYYALKQTYPSSTLLLPEKDRHPFTPPVDLTPTCIHRKPERAWRPGIHTKNHCLRRQCWPQYNPDSLIHLSQEFRLKNQF